MKTATGRPFLEVKRALSSEEFPEEFAKYVRSHGETYFFEPAEVHIITRGADARFVLTSPDFSADRSAFFISRMPDLDLNLIPDFFGVVQKMMVMSDDEDHGKRRGIAKGGFEEHILQSLMETIKSTVHRLVQKVKHTLSEQGGFEFTTALSEQLPTMILAEMFSIPEEDRLDFAKKSAIMTGFFGGASRYQNEDGIEVNEAAKALRTYFERLIEERRGKNGNDFVSILLRAQPGSGLSDLEIIAQMVMMLVAGQVTTMDQINNIMYLFALHPHLQQEVRANPALLGKALGELSRFDPAVTFLFRICRKAGRIGIQPIEVGQPIFISTHCVNRDDSELENPDRIDLTRKAKNMSAGHGPHQCMGGYLAQLEMTALFSEIFKELPLLTLDPQRRAVRNHYSVSFSGFHSLPVI